MAATRVPSDLDPSAPGRRRTTDASPRKGDKPSSGADPAIVWSLKNKSTLPFDQDDLERTAEWSPRPKSPRDNVGSPPSAPRARTAEARTEVGRPATNGSNGRRPARAPAQPSVAPPGNASRASRPGTTRNGSAQAGAATKTDGAARPPAATKTNGRRGRGGLQRDRSTAATKTNGAARPPAADQDQRGGAASRCREDQRRRYAALCG